MATNFTSQGSFCNALAPQSMFPFDRCNESHRLSEVPLPSHHQTSTHPHVLCLSHHNMRVIYML
ncbi:unnamed protein product [Periconia digitata]|uniref:Uncharacterized protein n=1 Tax=Periconia digitata TaxID=1303443 RepID=A0A9W4XLM3_9PLEO|nr:unnamed protein product [Periconia digitata]